MPMAKQKKPKEPKPPKVRSRYSIGEWYGRGFETLSPGDRFRLANTEYIASNIRIILIAYDPISPLNSTDAPGAARRFE